MLVFQLSKQQNRTWTSSSTVLLGCRKKKGVRKRGCNSLIWRFFAFVCVLLAFVRVYLALPLHVEDPHPTWRYPDQKVWVWVPSSSLRTPPFVTPPFCGTLIFGTPLDRARTKSFEAVAFLVGFPREVIHRRQFRNLEPYTKPPSDTSWSPFVDLPRKQKIGVRIFTVCSKTSNWKGKPTIFWAWTFSEPETLEKQRWKFAGKFAKDFTEKYVGNSPKICQIQLRTQPKSTLRNLGIKSCHCSRNNYRLTLKTENNSTLIPRTF